MKGKAYKIEPIPKDKHWEKEVPVKLAGGDGPDGVWNPKQARFRPTPHVKVNECDH